MGTHPDPKLTGESSDIDNRGKEFDEREFHPRGGLLNENNNLPNF